METNSLKLLSNLQKTNIIFICLREHKIFIKTYIYQNSYFKADALSSLAKMTELIKGYEFQLQKTVYLLSPKHKFWEVTMVDSEVRYRAGVIRNNQEFKIINVSKNYESNALAKGKIITKIAQKIDKGYYSNTANKIVQQVSKNKPVLRKKFQKLEETCDQTEQPKKTTRKRKIQVATKNKEVNKSLWKGFQKGQEIIQFHVRGNQIQTIRRCGQQQSSQLKVYQNYDKAVDFVHKKETELLKEGYKACVSEAYIKQEATTRRKPGSTTPNPLREEGNGKSLIDMTDNAMQLKSNLSVADEGTNHYIPNLRLGPPIDVCIKCLLAENYKDGTDPTGWIMSQKLDGVRCLWTGTEMYSRNGNKFHFPNFFTKNWPKSQLDGELFIGRGKFSQTLSAVKKNVPISSQWEQLKYLVFDAPGLKQPFKQRIKILEEQLAKVDNPFLKCHAHRPCKGFSDLFQQLDQVNKIGGEGIMLREPQAFYENKRSKNLQKVKTFYDDEAEIIGYTEGTGRCLGWVGALKVRNSKGVEFEVGSGLNDDLRQNPPDIGTKITYKYQQFNKQSGKPRFPTFLRVYTPV